MELRYRLLPCFHTLGWEAYLNGLPIIRPLFLEFPEDPETYTVNDQVMLGESILLAPVLKKNTKVRKVYLPEGKWFNFWTGHSYDGGQYLKIGILVDFLPIFVRQSTILPMSKPMSFIPKGYHFEHLILHFWPSFKGKIKFRDDDGMTTQYQSGKFSEMEIETSSNEKMQEISCSFTKSKICTSFGPKSLDLIFHCLTQPEWIKVDDRIQKKYEYDPLSKELKFSISIFRTSHHVLIKGTIS